MGAAFSAYPQDHRNFRPWKTPEIWVGLWLLEEGERRVPKPRRTFWKAISLCQLTFTQSRIKPKDRLFIFKELTQEIHSP